MGYDLKEIPAQASPHSTYQDYLDRDPGTVPRHFREVGNEDMGTVGLAPERYTSRAFYERERGMWDKVWQMACRVEHIPNVGDYHVYDVAKRSYLIVRVSETEIKAHPNVCLHRGRRLRTDSGHAEDFRCPFHGFTWALDGSCAHIPCEWDFPQVDQATFSLPKIQCNTWAGWVFINPDSNAMPLEDYLDPIQRHYEPYLWDQSYLSVHAGKVLKGNWKVIQEAFMESFHALDTHPQIVDDFGCQYDVWEGKPHVNRMMVPFAAPSSYVVHQVSEQDVYDEWRGGRPTANDGDWKTLAPGETARNAVAIENRAMAEEATGIDLSSVSDAELVDGWYYNIFPNMMFWGGYGSNMWYRFRPWNDSHEETLMEVGWISRHPAGQPKPEAAEYIHLDLDGRWEDVEALGSLGFVLDQDTTNMAAIQEGLNATFKSDVTLASYQESRIRHTHRTLDTYLDE
ncbi:MAG: aromatic ring-hydroxylating dioxygenase subunit alpha [Proteobacteria bacterium]|nr:aromatic ring-hydroxylating dioxygenase subunit alpha [Pseudomonadota bacterium]